MKRCVLVPLVAALWAAVVPCACSRGAGSASFAQSPDAEPLSALDQQQGVSDGDAEPGERDSAWQQEQAVARFVQSLSVADRLRELFLVNVEGSATYRAVETLGDHPLVPGGCILFSYNIASSAQGVAAYVDSVYEYCDRHGIATPPYIAVDQEGGLVNRLRDITSYLPSAQKVATLNPEQAELLYQSQARQMRLLGITMNLAPVAEPSMPQNAEFLGIRSYGDGQDVVRYAGAAIRAYEQNGVLCVLKHFPGNTNTDPHTGLPELDVTREDALGTLIEPFRQLLADAEPSGVLMSHARVGSVDPGVPACLSGQWVGGVLRDDMGFGGLVISDDIFMAALEQNGFAPEQSAVQAIRAGVDVILLSEKRFAHELVVLQNEYRADRAFAGLADAAACRVIAAKIRAGLLQVQQGADGEYRVAAAFDATERSQGREERLLQFDRERERGAALYASYFAAGQKAD